MNDTELITVTDLRRSYGPSRGRAAIDAPGHRFEAVRGLSFSVRRGEVCALLGTNGSGKTSTLEVVEGLAPPTSGTVRVLGHDPYRDRRSIRPRIGIMLQDAGFPADLSVLQLGRLWAGTLSSARPVDEALELVDLRQRAGVPIKQLSGGERRRLDLALALLGRPEILFLDEPTTGLDPQSRARTWGLVRDLVAAGLTMVLTTHYLAEAEQLADRIAILHEGRMVRFGRPRDVTAGQPARVSFTVPGDAALPRPDLPGALGWHQQLDGSTVVTTADLQPTLAALLRWADTHSVTLHHLHANPGTLEEAFLTLAETAAADTVTGDAA